MEGWGGTRMITRLFLCRHRRFHAFSVSFSPGVTKSAGDASNNGENRQGHCVSDSRRRVYSTVTRGPALVDSDIISREVGLGLVYVIFATY